jgi:hypothetical protein
MCLLCGTMRSHLPQHYSVALNVRLDLDEAHDRRDDHRVELEPHEHEEEVAVALADRVADLRERELRVCVCVRACALCANTATPRVCMPRNACDAVLCCVCLCLHFDARACTIR